MGRFNKLKLRQVSLQFVISVIGICLLFVICYLEFK